MSILALITGALYRAPERRVSKGGKEFVTATMVSKDGESFQYVRIVAFSNTVQDELLELKDGDAISITGPFKAELYTQENGEARISISVVVDQVMALRPRAKEKATANSAPISGQERARSSWQAPPYNDEIPF